MVDLDADLQRSVRHASYMRRGFYVVVLAVALAGQVSGAVEALHIPLVWAVPAVGALELGGIVVLANADVRRRLGERAVGSRLLSAAIAVGATAFNWLAHGEHLLGGFFAGMSALGYLVWLTHTENQRRDRLRATGDLPPTTPAYEVWGHWLRHPALTMRAKSLAKENPTLGLYDSLAAARMQVSETRRNAAIAKVLHRKIRAAVDPTTADIATEVYDLDQIAARLASGADYDGLTGLIAADLVPVQLAAPHADHATEAMLARDAEAAAVARAEAAAGLAAAESARRVQLEADLATVRAALDAESAVLTGERQARQVADAQADRVAEVLAALTRERDELRQHRAAAKTAAAKPAAGGRPAKRPATTADQVAKALARTPNATPAQIAAKLELSERTVQRHLQTLASTPEATPQATLHAVN